MPCCLSKSNSEGCPYHCLLFFFLLLLFLLLYWLLLHRDNQSASSWSTAMAACWDSSQCKAQHIVYITTFFLFLDAAAAGLGASSFSSSSDSCKAKEE
jgi:hypothetical protein